MLPLLNGTAPPPPTGYAFRGYTLLASKPNGGGRVTSYAVYTKIIQYRIKLKAKQHEEWFLTDAPGEPKKHMTLIQKVNDKVEN